MYSQGFREKVRTLRAKGKTYSEINALLGSVLSKSTIALWSKGVPLPESYGEKIRKLQKRNFKKAFEIAKKQRKEKYLKFIQDIEEQNAKLFKLYKDSFEVSKLVLAILYLAEGSKSPRGSLMFGNSDPLVVSLFVDLMRRCYKIDESKFRCTVQCRADHDTKALEMFWSKVTGVPLNQFYSTRIDKRTIGQPSRKKEYKGVCRIDYFSSAVDLELKYIARIIMTK